MSRTKKDAPLQIVASRKGYWRKKNPYRTSFHDQFYDDIDGFIWLEKNDNPQRILDQLPDSHYGVVSYIDGWRFFADKPWSNFILEKNFSKGTLVRQPLARKAAGGGYRKYPRVENTDIVVVFDEEVKAIHDMQRHASGFDNFVEIAIWSVGEKRRQLQERQATFYWDKLDSNKYTDENGTIYEKELPRSYRRADWRYYERDHENTNNSSNRQRMHLDSAVKSWNCGENLDNFDI